MRWSRVPIPLLALLVTTGADCQSADDDTAVEEPEILDPEPPGAPEGMVDGRLTCLGDNASPPAVSTTLELTGWVRRWADPEAEEEPPATQVEAFSPSGTSLGVAFTNPSPGQDGRVAVTVPITSDGFSGYVMITHDGYVPVRFHNSRPVTNTDFSGWIWLATQDEIEQVAAGLGLEIEAGTGILVGASHDCDAFGMSNVVVQVDGSTDGIYYVEGWDPVASRTFSAPSGRFALPNLPPGPFTVKAFGRLELGGPLVLLSRVDGEIVADTITEVALEPRVGVER